MSCSQLTKKNEPCKNKAKENGLCHIHKKVKKEEEIKKELSEKPINEKFKEDTCCICTEPFNEDFKPLHPCNHYIHIECVCNSGKDVCPVCKTPVLMTPSQTDKTNKINQKHRTEEEKEQFEALVNQEQNVLRELLIRNFMINVTYNIEMFVREIARNRQDININLEVPRLIDIYRRLVQENLELFPQMNLEQFGEHIFYLAVCEYMG